jgi:hypothetical protein
MPVGLLARMTFGLSNLPYHLCVITLKVRTKLFEAGPEVTTNKAGMIEITVGKTVLTTISSTRCQRRGRGVLSLQSRAI